jgi:hypothetical protein
MQETVWMSNNYFIYYEIVEISAIVDISWL